PFSCKLLNPFFLFFLCFYSPNVRISDLLLTHKSGFWLLGDSTKIFWNVSRRKRKNHPDDFFSYPKLKRKRIKNIGS
ncbi:MAG: hypothetical protein LUH01_00015, partial [Parabacteroides gordonii]|nr:hypothetical protein [Parabacteroides gordonii]